MKTLLYENQAIEAYQDSVAASQDVSLAFALVTMEGLSLLVGELESLLKGGGKLKFLVGVDMPSDPEAIGYLLALQRKYAAAFSLKVFQSTGAGVADPNLGIFHSKFGVFTSRRGRRTAILGSSNLTAGGMIKNLEANLLLEERTMIEELEGYFSEHFEGGRARPVSDAWLERYSIHWAELKKLERPKPVVDGREVSIPARIRGYRFAFTGKIWGWPRDGVLYPMVRKLGGTIAPRADSMASASALVHGNILGGASTTKKLREAAQRGVLVMSEDEFFKAVANEKRARARKKTPRK